MKTTPLARESPTPVNAGSGGRRWLLFIHQLPAKPSNLRVRTWRRLQQLGALPLRQALYVLPDTPAAREDFEWLKTEIAAAGGHANVFAADAVDSWSSDALVEEFRRSREALYAAIARAAEQILKRLGRRAPVTVSRRTFQQLTERLAAVEQIDFFGSAGRDRAVALLAQIESLGRSAGRPLATGSKPSRSDQYQGRLWVTRPRPGIDRISSAWLIRRFIDAKARFSFVADRAAAPPDTVPFDMFGVEFTHRGDLCTFETLCELFELSDAALPAIAAIVHDLDLKDGRFGAADAPTVGLLIEGLRLAHHDDDALLNAGIPLFEALYRALTQAKRIKGPTPVATRRSTSTRPRRKHQRAGA
jgi:hypothetical protein